MEEKKKKSFIKWLKDKILSKKDAKKDFQLQYPVPYMREGFGNMNDKYLFDFSKFQGEFVQNNVAFNRPGIGTSKGADVPKKIKIKPIDVVDQLERVPTPFTLAGLDEKIEVLKDKLDMTQRGNVKQEIEGLIERLENRKKYIEFKDFFERFQNTTEGKIAKLLEKYELVKESSDLFIPEFPDEAIKVMREYSNKVEEVCGKRPIFYVIAEQKLFKKVAERKDPILLAQSPFGNFYQILGAWDKEMLLLDEL